MKSISPSSRAALRTENAVSEWGDTRVSDGVTMTRRARTFRQDMHVDLCLRVFTSLAGCKHICSFSQNWSTSSLTVSNNGKCGLCALFSWTLSLQWVVLVVK